MTAFAAVASRGKSSVMKAARLAVLGVAVAAGGIAAYLASSGKEPEAPPPPPVAALETVEVLVLSLIHI